MKDRNPTYPINKIILNRWSARAMSGETITDDELMPLFEAGRWAPSAMNNQLWRFIYAKRDTKYWQSFFNLLVDGNKIWCKNASALIIIISRKNAIYKERPQRTHSFEAGSAFENLAIEGVSRGLVVHPLGGFDIDGAHKLLKLTDVWDIKCMIAVGKPGNVQELPEDIRKRETPSDRLPLTEIVFEGHFPVSLGGKND